MLYNHSGYVIRRERLRGEDKTAVDIFQEEIIMKDLRDIFSFSRDESIKYYCEWYKNNFE